MHTAFVYVAAGTVLNFSRGSTTGVKIQRKKYIMEWFGDDERLFYGFSVAF